MSLIIQNTTPALTADLQALGAAVKILLAGGSSLGSDKMFVASGASRFIWERRSAEIIALVQSMEADNQPRKV